MIQGILELIEYALRKRNPASVRLCIFDSQNSAFHEKDLQILIVHDSRMPCRRIGLDYKKY